MLKSTWLFHRGLATAIVPGSAAGVPLYILSLSDSGRDQALWIVELGGVTAFAASTSAELLLQACKHSIHRCM